MDSQQGEIAMKKRNIGNGIEYTDVFKEEEIKAKAEAFDKIAQNYYNGNFGTMQKSDIDVLMFSIYWDKILEKSEEDWDTYSDYELSKVLGITQAKVSNLKVKKQLRYPYLGFDWKKSFIRASKNARFENGKIKIHIPERNLFIELQNAIEKNGGYLDIQLNSKLLQVSPEDFINLIGIISDEEDRDLVKKKIREELRKSTNDRDIKYLEELTLAENFKNYLSDGAKNLIPELLKLIISI